MRNEPDIAKIAAGLSADAKKALLMFGNSDLPGNMLMVEPGDGPVVEELLHACCVSHIKAAGYQFISERSTGLAVSAHLENADEQG
jgi:hypothetical protein